MSFLDNKCHITKLSVNTINLQSIATLLVELTRQAGIAANTTIH